MSNWYSESSPLERRTFWASFGGWALDALDVQMFGLAIPAKERKSFTTSLCTKVKTIVLECLAI